MKKRLLALLTVATLMVSSLPLNVGATTERQDIILPISASTSTSPSMSAEDILSEFHYRSFITQSQANTSSTRTTHTPDTAESLASIRHETVNKLLDMGYHAYEVTSNTYNTVEELLNTDLSDFGLQKDSSYSQASTVDLMKSHKDEAISAMLNAAIGAYATAVGVPTIFGTIGSITGLTTVNFVSKKDSTAIYHAGSSWTKVFTQVWDADYNSFVFGSHVESLEQLSFVSGMQYDPSLNRYMRYDSEDEIKTTKSPEYYHSKWQNDNAVLSFIGAFPPVYDTTGNAVYTYDGDNIVTHRNSVI